MQARVHLAHGTLRIYRADILDDRATMSRQPSSARFKPIELIKISRDS
jgi:hypothetical protein